MNDQTVAIIRTVWNKYDNNKLSQELLALSIRMSTEDSIIATTFEGTARNLAMIALRDVGFNEIARLIIQDGKPF